MIMKPHFLKLILLFVTMILCTVTCKTHVSKTAQKETDNRWIEEMTIQQLQQGYKDGKYTVKDIVKVYLNRINEIDKDGPRLNSIIVVNPDALSIADKLDKETADGKPKGPLFGVPVILKDNIDTHDSMPTTSGAPALRNSFLATDSFIAKKLREAGAVRRAKSNRSEGANFRAKRSSSGWSGVGGQTRNPYV